MRFYITQEKINNKEIIKYLKFLFFGLPSLSLAIVLNILMVEYIGINKSTSYSLITSLQIIANFYLLNKYIFNKKKNKSKVISFLLYAFGILTIRTIDWLIYSKLVNYFSNLYVLIQIISTGFFSILKFKYLKYIMD